MKQLLSLCRILTIRPSHRWWTVGSLSLGMILLNASVTRGSSQSKAATADSPPEKANMEHALFAPRPEYPYLARVQRIAGSGVAVMKIDPKTGLVVRAFMAISTGASILDEATLSAVQRWKFKPGTVRFVKLPISYTVTGGSLVGHRGYERHSKSMDDVLAGYLGKGTVFEWADPGVSHRDTGRVQRRARRLRIACRKVRSCRKCQGLEEQRRSVV